MRNQLVVDLALDRSDLDPFESDRPDEGHFALQLRFEGDQPAGRTAPDGRCPKSLAFRTSSPLSH
jgi:hypothetical protein